MFNADLLFNCIKCQTIKDIIFLQPFPDAFDVSLTLSLISGFRFQVSGFRFQVSNSRCQISNITYIFKYFRFIPSFYQFLVYKSKLSKIWFFNFFQLLVFIKSQKHEDSNISPIFLIYIKKGQKYENINIFSIFFLSTFSFFLLFSHLIPMEDERYGKYCNFQNVIHI